MQKTQQNTMTAKLIHMKKNRNERKKIKWRRQKWRMYNWKTHTDDDDDDGGARTS